MLTVLASVALAGTATLHVGVPRDLGTPADIVVEGADGPCEATAAHLRCPATATVHFRWKDADHVLYGRTRIAPGETGRAWVLSPRGSQEAVRAHVADIVSEDPTGLDLVALRRVFVYTSQWTPYWPSPGLLEDHLHLLTHEDARVRREALEGLHPWLAGTRYDPLPVEAPVPLRSGDLRRISDDPDPGMRKRLARILRDARPDVPQPLVRELVAKLLADPNPGVRRAAIVTLPELVDSGTFAAADAWATTVAMVPEPRPSGRAACNQLARLRSRVDRAGIEVDVRSALELVLAHHPERGWRVWTAWRASLPVEEAWIQRLLDDTVGVDPTLVGHWAVTDRAALDRAMVAWDADRHPERREMVEDAIVRADRKEAKRRARAARKGRRLPPGGAPKGDPVPE